ncbi:MAG: PIN domain-containing protein [Acidimicrobiales bacterium]|nr:PIN domain-containing protein [Acidimicrobiales bacterium]
MATHLADTSALLELHQPQVAARLGPLLVGGQVATCGVVDLEILARAAPDERTEVLAERRSFPRVPVDDEVLDRAAVLIARLHGAVELPRLIVAVAAERAGLVLLHHDTQVERIGAVTGQPLEDVVRAVDGAQ